MSTETMNLVTAVLLFNLCWGFEAVANGSQRSKIDSNYCSYFLFEFAIEGESVHQLIDVDWS